MSDHAPRAGERTGRGFSTRAIAAASRAPRLEQTPTSVPIYQTATFSSVDADELAEVLGGPRADLEDLQADVAVALEAARRVAPAPAAT